MKIIVVSDSHGSFDSLHKIITANSGADMFIHLGDGEREYDDICTLFGGECRYVRGNNDYGVFRASQVFKAGSHTFYITHGHHLNVHSSTDFVYSAAVTNDCNVALFGHTHVKLYEKRGNVHIFNPGSCYCPRGGAAPSYGIITIEGDGIEFRHVDIKE